MGTFAENILSRKSGKTVSAGGTVVVDIDAAMLTDATGPLAVTAFKEMGGIKVKKPARTVVVIDHASPTPNEKIANLQQMLRQFCREQGLVLYDQGEGICHELMVEKGHVHSGEIVLGADSHTCTYGAIGAFSTGVGSTDLAAVLLTGKSWLRVPESVKVSLTGKMPCGVSAKDVVLSLAGRLTIDGATYACMEIAGPGADQMAVEERLTIANMAVEMGAKAGVFIAAIEDPELQPDAGAQYAAEYAFDLSRCEAMIACPDTVDHVTAVREQANVRIHQAFIGSCTNGRLSDLAIAANVLKDKKVAAGVRLVVAPASRQIYLEAIKQNYLQVLIAAGATVLPPGCGPCVGTLGGIPGDGDVVISTTNRNFKGRMGNAKSSIYLASPLTVAVSALRGRITDPREVLA